MCGQLHESGPFYPPKNELLVPTEWESWWFPELVLNLCESEKNLMFVSGVEPRIVQPVITEIKNETKFTWKPAVRGRILLKPITKFTLQQHAAMPSLRALQHRRRPEGRLAYP
jgi:hypothetical protein